jgi:phage tail P2-like protein
MNVPILPNNATSVERALESQSFRLDEMPVEIAKLWTPATCPEAFLPWLAAGLSVDDWDSRWFEATKRAYLAASIDIHRHKGTVGAIKRKLAVLGYGDAILSEYSSLPKIGDAPPIGAGWRIGWAGMQWADFIVELTKAVTRTEADRLEYHLTTVAPARCRLWKIIIGQGVNYVIGDGLWTIGPDTSIGGIYEYEVQYA